MKIGFDAKRAVSNMTGLGNYSRLVIEELAERSPENLLLLYVPKLTESMRSNPRLNRINTMPNIEYRLPYGLGPFSKGALWRSFGISRHFQADRLDLFHGLSNELPLNSESAGVPTVVTVHDLIYRRLPYCYAAMDRKIYDYKYKRSARIATRVVAISECTKRDLVELHGVDPEKIDVIYQGCDPGFRRKARPDEITAMECRYNLPERYLLQVGTIERRKNLELSVRALAGISDKEIKLVAVGRDNNYLPYIKKLADQLGVADRLIFLQGLPFSDLPILNQGAQAILYPSRYEGFGIPVLEGLESRRPVVAATGSCLEEAGGKGAFYVNPDNPRQMVETLNAILGGEANLETHIHEGLIHAARFNPDTMVNLLEATYEKAIADYRQKR